MMAGLRKLIQCHFRRGLTSVSRVPHCTCYTKAKSGLLSPKAKSHQVSLPATYGQPTPDTHPHIMKEGEVTPGIRLEEFQERRYRLMNAIHERAAKHDNKPKHHVVVIPSSSKVYMTEKIPYVFRQNTDFLYLTGCLEPDSALVLTGCNGDDHRSTLFVRKRDTHSELWDGPRTGIEGAPKLFGVNEALLISEMDNFLVSFTKTNRSFQLWYDFLVPTQNDVQKVMRNFLNESLNKMWESPKPLIHRLRLYKSPAEIALMTQSCKVASDAIAATIRSSHPGVTENQLFARVDYECRMNGAEFLAYPPVVAGGSRANIIHYINNDQLVKEGETILMDAGCEYHGYSSDITRTWPLSGKFSPRQLDLYEAVLDVQTELIKECGNFPSLDHLFHQMCSLLGRHLKEFGFVSKIASEEEMSKVAYSFCPHHVSHYLGMDVHDTASVPRSIRLEPGMIITIEPGLYVNSKNKLAPLEFQGLGVRIEDDILITENGPVVLTDPCPKQVKDIETLFLTTTS